MEFWQVDAFTNQPFSGNPAAVFIVETFLDVALMQNIATEMNLSETVFVTLGKNPEIRWFTPGEEVNLCGHATLAAAHIIWQEGMWSENTISFQSRSGPLSVVKNTKGYTLDFPSQPPVEKEKCMHDLAPLYVGSNGEDCMLVVESSKDVENYKPDWDAIRALDERGFLLTAKDSSGEYDYVYRAFFPKLGLAEDPVTGSANTCLAPYWAKALGKTKLSARQISTRGGDLGIEVTGSRVLITGEAITVLEGDFFL